MAIWSVRDAKARFSALLRAWLREGPQRVTRRGVELAVLVPAAAWARLQQAASPGLKALLSADTARDDLILPRRGALRRRPPPDLG